MWIELKMAWRAIATRPLLNALTTLTMAAPLAAVAVCAGVLHEYFAADLRSPDGSALVTLLASRAAPPWFRTLSFAEFHRAAERFDGVAELAAFMRIQNSLSTNAVDMRLSGELVSSRYFSCTSGACSAWCHTDRE